MLKNKSIGAKVSCVMAVVILIALLATTYLNVTSSTNIIKSQVDVNMKAHVDASATIISKQIEIYKTQVECTASRARIKSLDWAQQLPVLKMDAEDFKFLDIAFATADGKQTKASNASKADVSKKEYFKEAMKGKTYISDPEISNINGKFVINIATPVKDERGDITGIVVAMVDSQILSTLSKDVKGSPSGYGYVLDSRGTVIGHKDEKLVKTQDNVFNNIKKDSGLKSLSDIVTKVIRGQSGVDEYTYKGTVKYVAYAPVSGTSWFLVSVGLKSETMSQVDSSRNTSIFMAAFFIILACILCVLLITVMVARPLKKTVHMIEELAKGHLKGRLAVKSRDEIGKMSGAMNMLADTLQYNVLGSMRQIAEGDMDVEIDSKDADDEIAPVIRETAATVKDIVNETSEIIEAVKEGNLDNRCDDRKYKGDWKTMAQKINALCDSVAEPIGEVRGVIEKISLNDYTVQVEGSYQGVFKDLGDDVNRLNARLHNLQSIIVNISKGDTSRLSELEKIGRRSENDNLMPATINMMRTIEDLIQQTHRLTGEAAAGNVVNNRGDETKFEGGYREIIRGINSTLDAVSTPLSETLSVLEKMAVNDFTLQMSEGYQGDFKVLVQAVNDVQDRLQHIQSTVVMIANGDISELETFKAIGKRSENDQLVPAFTRMMKSIQLLIDEITGIAQSAAAGKLDLRGDASRYSGGYAQIIGAVNSFLDAVEKPTNEITAVMNAIAEADFGKTIEGEFHGQFKVMVDSVNQTSMRLSGIISEVSDVISRMAGGDFGIETIEEYNGDFKAISDALNTILDSLNELFSNVAQTSAQVAAGSAQVSQGSQTLSQGATEQASSVEELSASITEIAGKTKNNAMSAGKANSLTAEVKAGASDGKHRMDDMLKSMDEISESSNNISKIIKVIDDIAFQTNILALNAAVEAARAGQYGKGFAVVAEEVRNLAGKSAEAARDTTALIEGTVKKVESGTEIAKTTAGALDGIVKGIDSVADLVEEIAAASNEQATGISQINSGLEQVSRVIQTNSATAEESAAASEELSSQATVLEEQVAKFVLRGTKTADGVKVAHADKTAQGSKKAPERPDEPRPEVLLDDEYGKY